MRHAIHGAAPCPDHIKRAMIDWWGTCVEEYYAASEGGGAFATAEDWLKKPGTVGRPWPISAVADAAAFGVPHHDWGEQVKAVVEPAEGHVPDPEPAGSILDHCAQRLAGYKRPESVDFIAETPRDPNGKLYKRRLREPYWEGRERPV